VSRPLSSFLWCFCCLFEEYTCLFWPVQTVFCRRQSNWFGLVLVS